MIAIFCIETGTIAYGLQNFNLFFETKIATKYKIQSLIGRVYLYVSVIKNEYAKYNRIFN